MKKLTIVLVPQMGRTVCKSMINYVTTYIGTRHCITDNESPAIQVTCDLSEKDKIEITKMAQNNWNCATFFIYLNADEDTTAADYCDLEIIYKEEPSKNNNDDFSNNQSVNLHRYRRAILHGTSILDISKWK